MTKATQLLEQAAEILRDLDMPKQQQNTMSCLTLLALCRITTLNTWTSARAESLTIRKGIMDFISVEFNEKYAENTRESFRRSVLHQFVQAGLVLLNPDNPKLPTTSSKTHYRMSDEAIHTIKTFGTYQWSEQLSHFKQNIGTLREKYASERRHFLVPLKISEDKVLYLSAGRHNEVQAAVVKHFGPIFAPGARLLYLGDTAQKNLHVLKEELEDLNISFNVHDKMPDIVLYDEEKKWLFLIEAVTSHGPMSAKRVLELKKALSTCGAGLIFVSAFPDMKEFKRHVDAIAWDTEVWIADTPEHLMHFNGDRFLGPRKIV